MERKPVWIIGYKSNSAEAQETLKSADQVYARGNLVARGLMDIGAQNLTPVLFGMDESTLEETVTALLDGYESGKAMAYATVVNPLAADVVVKNLIGRSADIQLRWANGETFTEDSEVAGLLAARAGLTVIDGQELAAVYHIPFAPSQAALIYAPGEGVGLAGIAALLQAVYPADHTVRLLFERADGELCWNQKLIDDIAQITTPVAAMLVPPRSADASLEDFEEVIARLRAPNGCPWDRKQTHASLRTYLLEETYEALSALDANDMEGLKEELGDLTLQIALHTQIGAESGEFNMADVLEGINRKIIRRHPHIFGDVVVAGEKGVVQNWEKLKQQEREDNGTHETKGLLDGIPVSFPALAQAQSIQDRAARVGFDWKEIEPVMDKVMEEYREVQEAPNEEERAKELGDLLFAVVNLVRWYKVDAESALRETNLKFRKRFAYIEKRSRETGKPMQEMTLEEMDVFWNEAKKL
jgi:tetrapyrrole methylase family protein/MazG family protein